jgi:translation initiation factor 1
MNKIVFSTDPNWSVKCENCGNLKENCTCTESVSKTFKNQTAYIKRDRKGRGGKTVTIVTNLSGDIKSLQKELQKKCASGGTLKKDALEIQGDHLEKIRVILQKKGCNVKKVGG